MNCTWERRIGRRALGMHDVAGPLIVADNRLLSKPQVNIRINA